jgi:hypothetical protein
MRKVIDDNRCRFVIVKWRQVLNIRRAEQEAEDEWVRSIRTELDSCKYAIFIPLDFPNTNMK